MDVWNDRIWDIGLNTLGYLIAGGLGMLMYSVIYGRRCEGAPEAKTATAPAPAAATDGPAQFVDLRTQSSPSVAPAATGRRDKAEVVRLARKMLQAGADRDIIKRTVPISDGELNLLEAAGSVR